MTTSYFTFGQKHEHRIGDLVFDKDCVAKVTSDDPRAAMLAAFGPKWAFEYPEPPDMAHYPRGIVNLPLEVQAKTLSSNDKVPKV